VKPERIAEIEDALRAPGFGLAGIERHELLHLLRCALAWAELEAWLRAQEEWRYIQASAVVGEGEMQSMLCDGTAVGKADKIVSIEAGPDLLTATEAALAKAKETPNGE